MSVISGIWCKDGCHVERRDLHRQAEATARYGPDCTNVWAVGFLGMSVQAFHTHARSAVEPGPIEDASGNVCAFDGRLDNYDALIHDLGIQNSSTGDTALVLASFRKWGEDSFARLVGDWSLSLWAAQSRTLYLARDHAGTRLLYCRTVGQRIVWSTYPEGVLAERHAAYSNEYFIRYLASLPLADQTPYEGVLTIPPGHYLSFSATDAARAKRYWSPSLQLPPTSCSDECHRGTFLHFFKQAVRRRIDGMGSMVCHLSGGMDSSSIVCIADQLCEEANVADRISTVSFYDKSEPNWDDHRYFSIVEAYRGKQGAHMSIAESRSFDPAGFQYPLPGADSQSVQKEREFADAIGRGSLRAIVAGHGGDELFGGRPDPVPELSDLLIQLRWISLMRQTFIWALSLRRTVVGLLGESSRLISRTYMSASPANLDRLSPWLFHLREEIDRIVSMRKRREGFFRKMPTQIDLEDTWDRLLETLPHLFHTAIVRYEFRYPFLDRDLVDFVTSVPLSQLRKPNRRRYMMRGALTGIVPTEILERRRKAFVSRGPLVAIHANKEKIASLVSCGELVRRGLIEKQTFLQMLSTIDGRSIPKWLPSMRRAIDLELWLSQANH